LFWRRLKQKGIASAAPPTVVAALREAARLNTLQNLQYHGELRILLSALKAENIPLILLKGIHLDGAVYERIGLREMNDLDVLVKPADLAQIVRIAGGLGYRPLRAITPDHFNPHASAHHLPGLVKDRVRIEIHWSLLPAAEDNQPDPAEYWERARPIAMAGGTALALAPEDLLLHLCLHVAYHHCFVFGLRPACDIAETIDRFGTELDWPALVERAARHDRQRGVYLALRLAAELAGAAVPDTILASLRPDDISETILAAAQTQVFTYQNYDSALSVAFAELLESRRLADQIRIFRRQVFLPKAVLADQYEVALRSPALYLCYFRRFFDLLRRHGPTLRKYRNHDPALTSMADRKVRLTNWLARPASNPQAAD
jgi:hypothetical protein